MADLNLKTGLKVETQDGRQGTIRYIGPIHVAPGEWLGLELADESGKNDGSVKGERYFQCAPGYGIFVRKESAVKIIPQPAQPPKLAGASTTNGTSAKPRPSSGVTADMARKRQSLMSGGSAATVGSRLSMRSPTKSPTKPTPSSASSTTSTPRTGTPATTARTSDSSSKSRLSTAGKPLMAPPASTSRASLSAARQSTGGGGGSLGKSSATRPGSTQTRTAAASSRLSMAPKSTPRAETTSPTTDTSEPHSGQQDVALTSVTNNDENADEGNEEHPSSPPTVAPPVPVPAPIALNSQSRVPPRDINGATPEDRSRQAQVIKALETKVRALQKQRQEDQAQIQSIQDLQTQVTRYEGIIQTLQKKLKANQQEIQDLQVKYQDAESRAAKVPDRSAEQESELELATLDKEMAEERADLFEAELESLKLKHEELELEAEILREENRELTSVMSPEEKASAGWLQKERESERLRQALILLRDMSQQNESDLRNEIKELQETLDEVQQTASKYEEVAASLSRSEETNQLLKEQLEATEANDEILEAMGAERDQSRNALELLKRQIQDLEEQIQVTDELEAFHVEEERRLHYQLDECEALLNDRYRQAAEQEKTIEDLEYTLTKFRDVVQGLQSDIDELRRSRELSELEVHEMTSKSRAMLDLNLKLQNTAAKTQLKTIDLELGKMRAEEASLHLDIVQLFVPESFEVDRKPILALLCFKRIKSKALLSKNILSERIRDRVELHDDPMSVFAVMERMNFIANLCERFAQHLSACSPDDFMKYSGAPFELEPVEHAVTGWVEALRRDELVPEGSELLHRMAEILVDMAEKLIPESRETKVMELISSISMIENYTDSIAGQTTIISKAMQIKIGAPKDEDDDSVLFEKRMDQLGIKARTVRYVAGKIMNALTDFRTRSMCLGESTWTQFIEAESNAQTLSFLSRRVGEVVTAELNNIELDEPLSYARITRLMTSVVAAESEKTDSQTDAPADVFEILSRQLQALQGKVDELNTKSADVSSAMEFEKLPTPWTVRAKEVKAQKVLSQDLQEEMGRLKLRIQEQTVKISEKDKELEEQQVKVELLESRAKDTKARDDGVKAMKEEIEKLRAESATASANLQKLESEYQILLESRDSQRLELDAIKQQGISDRQGLALGPIDDTVSLRLKAELDLLKVEIASLQAAVRFLKSENQQLRVPAGIVSMDAIEQAWLDPSQLKMPFKHDKAQPLRAESKEVFANLIQLAKASKPILLRPKPVQDREQHGHASSRRTESDTTLYHILQRKEQLERWKEMRDDLVKRAKIESRPLRPRGPAWPERPLREESSLKKVIQGESGTEEAALVDTDIGVDGVRIVRE